jgi:hypothetical protein
MKIRSSRALFIFVRCVSEVDSLLPWVLSAAVVGIIAIARPTVANGSVSVDPRRSLVVTEKTILARFPLERVLDQLVAQSGVPGLTSLDLFHQWWDTQNPARLGLGLGLHCDDTVNAKVEPEINEFPYTCRPAPAEGVQATTEPFVDPNNNPDAYLPVGLFNRFDLAPRDGSHCGEYRIVYAKRSGKDNGLVRNLIIFEAALPNPLPGLGLNGCRGIAGFWAALTHVDDIDRRAEALKNFYFNGIPGVAPVVHVDHYGGNANGFGQVRTNQFMQEEANPKVWSLREFKLVRTCNDGACTAMQFVPVTDKSNPFGPLFAPNLPHRKAGEFQAFFSLEKQVKALAVPNLTDIDFKPDDKFNTAQSQASSSDENNYAAQFTRDPSQLRRDIQEELDAIGSALSPDDIVLRAQALSCAGCHQLNNGQPVGGGLTWPSSLGFTHTTEQEKEKTVDGQDRFLISKALIEVFLPKRKQVLEDFLNDIPLIDLRPQEFRGPKDPIGVFRVH